MDKKLLILYGAGEYGEALINKCNKLNIHVECLCDADLKKKGLCISGIVVKSIDEVKSQYKKGEYCIFVSMKPTNAMAVKSELVSQNVFDSSDFCVEDTFDKLIVGRLSKKAKNNKEKRELCVSSTEKNIILLNNEQEDALKEVLLKTKFSDKDYMDTEYGKKGFLDHLYNRLNDFRRSFIPWLESIRPIKNSKILEIGCGTGSTTIALCEQGANVYAIDVDEQGLEITKKRLDIYGLCAEVEKVSSVDIKTKTHGDFDFIIYSASMEHMTYTERIQTIKAAYDMISDNQYIVLVDVPNRLWHTDSHTSLEPFYDWLPDALAMDYAKYTEREIFNHGFDKDSGDELIRLYRWGRGVSYHEFEVAVGCGKLCVVSDMYDFFDVPYDLYKLCLKINGPSHIDDGFYSRALNIVLKKKV